MSAEEVVLGVQETNRLRIQLGLKPLDEGPPKSEKVGPKPPEPKKAEDPEAVRAKIAEAREKRRREEELRATATLGAVGDDVDDLAGWASRINAAKGAPAAAGAAAAAAGGGSSQPSKRRRRGGGGGGEQQQGEGDGEDGDGEQHLPADLAGVRVKHDVAGLAEGETVVLTLADTGILDERGELAEGPDTLENALLVEEKARRRARAAATKTAKPLWEEDGKVRSLLDKYDEEEEDALAAFDASGGLALTEQQAQAARQRQAELSNKLAAGAASLLGGGADAANGNGAAGGWAGRGSDYYTADELAKGDKQGKEKKKKKRKLRTTKVAADEDGGEGGGLDLDALEAAAAAEAAGGGGGEAAAHLGSRAAREARAAQQEAARAAAAAERSARFEAALGRANLASEALRPAAAAAAAAEAGGSDGMMVDGEVDGDDADDDELAASLARARRLARKGGSAADGGSDVAGGGVAGGGGSSLEELARQLAAKREEDEERLKQQLAAGGTEGLLSETAEFVRTIQPTGPKAEESANSYMDVDEPAPPPPPPSAAAAAGGAGGGGEGGEGSMLPPPPPGSRPSLPPKAARKYRTGGWVAAGDEQDGDEQANGNEEGGGRGRKRPAPELEDTGVVGEQAMGKGLAACLGLIKDKGLLKDKTQWAGRTNDMKPVALIGLDDVYTGGSHEDAQAQRIETALTQRDEFGRVMAPKERFRVFCHQFHGMPPSKNKQEQRQRKYMEEQAVARATSSENPSAELDRLKELQRTTGSAYIPLTGRLKPATNSGLREDISGLATGTRTAGGGMASSMAPTPRLGGGLTPLSGDAKVEAMLGISKAGGGRGGGKGSGSMPPPAPRK